MQTETNTTVGVAGAPGARAGINSKEYALYEDDWPEEEERFGVKFGKNEGILLKFTLLLRCCRAIAVNMGECCQPDLDRLG